MAPSIHKLTALIFVTAGFLASSTVSKPTQFNQCDKEWKDKRLGNKPDWPTICEGGDQLTVLAMIADGCSIKFPANVQVNPGTLNDWLAVMDGFKSDRSIDISKINQLDLKNTLETDQLNKIKMQFKYNWYEVAVKDSKGKWFALKSYSSSKLVVSDPNDNKVESIKNEDFRLGDVFYNQKCKRGGNLLGFENADELFLSE